MKNIIWLNGFTVDGNTEEEIKKEVKQRLQELLDSDQIQYEVEEANDM